MEKLELVLGIGTIKLDHWVGSSAAKVYCQAIRDGKGIPTARLLGEIARCQENIGDIAAGLPPLAVGEFTDVSNVRGEWNDTDNLLEEIPSCLCEYISGSGTRYLLRNDEIVARIATEETRTQFPKDELRHDTEYHRFGN